MRKALLLLPILVMALAATAARADSYSFTITGTGISGSGTIVVSASGTPGVDKITGITGTYSDTNSGGFSGSISSLAVGSYSASSPTVISAAPAGYTDSYDNLFYPGGTAASCQGNPAGGLLDFCGLTFTVGGDYVNLFGEGSGTYGLYDWTPSNLVQFNVPVKASFSLVPEPGTLSLLLMGLGVVALLGASRNRKTQGLPQAA
jgi:hypothetical protein